jgi:LPXTG-motif cell wall-anchored protein
VTETAVVQKVVMKDEYAVGKIVIEKTDENTKKPIAGVEFEIRDKDGNVIETLVTDKNGHAESSRLPICTYNEDGSFKENICYTVVETKAVDGYILDETAYEVVLSYEDDATDCVTYTLSLTNKPIGGNSPQTGDDSNPWLWAGVGLAALIAGLGAFFWKRKDENVIE